MKFEGQADPRRRTKPDRDHRYDILIKIEGGSHHNTAEQIGGQRQTTEQQHERRRKRDQNPASRHAASGISLKD